MKKGAGLIEMLIVIAIIVILSVVTFSAFVNTYTSNALDKATATALSMLSQAKEYTLASKNNDTFGVHFASTTLTLFQGSSYVAGNSQNEVVTLDPRVNVVSTSLAGGGQDVVFARINGTTTNAGTITLALTSSSTVTKVITVFATGIMQSN